MFLQQTHGEIFVMHGIMDAAKVRVNFVSLRRGQAGYTTRGENSVSNRVIVS